MRALTAAALLLAMAAPAQTPENTALLTEVTHAAAHAEALTEFCSLSNRSAAPGYGLALNQWRQRNHWEVVKSFWSRQPDLEQTFNQDRAAAAANYKQHTFKSAMSCGHIAQVLRSSAFDPSLKHAAELARLRPPSAPQPARTGDPTRPDGAQPVFRPAPPPSDSDANPPQRPCPLPAAPRALRLEGRHRSSIEPPPLSASTRRDDP